MYFFRSTVFIVYLCKCLCLYVMRAFDVHFIKATNLLTSLLFMSVHHET